MKITRVETVYYEDNDRFLWVRLHTDDGFVGLGETYVHAAPARAMIEHTFAPHFLLGCNPLQREAIWRDLFERCNYVGWAGAEIRAISAIDIALWDIIAQVSAQPLYQLLGGATRPAIPVYNTCGPQPDFDFRRNPGPLAQDLLAQGISIMKIWPFDEIAVETRGQRIDPWHLEAALQPFREIREATAGRMQVAVEFHGHWNLPSAVRIARALEDYDILWLEDLLPADNLEALQTLAASTRLPLVISERLFTRYQFLPLLQSGAAQIVNPDIEWCGGISEALKIAALAETFHIPVAFHNYGGPLLNAVTAHVATAIPNLMIVETGRDLLAHWEDEGVLTNNVSVQNGMITPFSEPGLGTSLRAEFLSRENVRVNYIDLV